MATDTLPTNSSAWPQVGNPPPNALSPTDPNPEWEMVADDTTNNTVSSGSEGKTNTDNNNNDHIVILPADIETSIKSNKIKGRPRSATIGGSSGQVSSYSYSTPATHHNKSTTQPNFADRSSTTNHPSESTPGDTSIHSDLSSRTKRRVLRRCASTPDLLMSDNAHEVIVEDESDDETTNSSTDSEEPEEDVVLEESFEVVSDNDEENNNEREVYDQQDADDDDDDDSGEGTDEPLFMIDDEDTDIHRCDEESATL
eukprot:scaffold32957_cov188-Skeletonema_menzelii.AAC.1